MSAIAALLVLAVFSASTADAQTPVEVGIYYSSLDPESINFITKQLHPTYQKLAKYIKPNFVPYGNTENKDGELTCPLGADECLGNVIHCCTVIKITDDMKRVNFINCLMTKETILTATAECATDLSESSLDIDACVNSTEGNTTLGDMGNKTMALDPPLTSIPTITFDMKYTADEVKEATKDFKSVLCSKIAGTKPEACGSATISAYAVPSLVFALAAILPAAVVH